MKSTAKRCLAIAWVCGALVACGKKERASSSSAAATPPRAQKTVSGAVPMPVAAPEVATLDPYWDGPEFIAVTHDQKCPPTLEALFSGGADAAKSKTATYVAVLRGPHQVKLGEYVPKDGGFPIEVMGVLFCHAADGKLISVALGAHPQPYIPGERDVGEHYWKAQPLMAQTQVPFAESKDFANKTRLGLNARVVFQVGKTEQHKKIITTRETAEEAAERKKHNIPKAGNGTEDWGAGRLVHAQVKGFRIATFPAHTLLFEKRVPR